MQKKNNKNKGFQPIDPNPFDFSGTESKVILFFICLFFVSIFVFWLLGL